MLGDMLILSHVVDTPQRMENLLNAPTLKHRRILNENVVGVEKYNQ